MIHKGLSNPPFMEKCPRKTVGLSHAIVLESNAQTDPGSSVAYVSFVDLDLGRLTVKGLGPAVARMPFLRLCLGLQSFDHNLLAVGGLATHFQAKPPDIPVLSLLFETMFNHSWLVVWNMNFMTFHILGTSSS